MTVSFDVVIPTTGRPALAGLLAALADPGGPLPERIVLVDDRRDAGGPLVGDGPPVRGRNDARAERAAPPVRALPARVRARTVVVPGPRRGPAAARNRGWRAGAAPWVAFLDDDVLPAPGWAAALAADLDGLGTEVAASQGRIAVPLPGTRRATDWERNVAGLERARWATADLACRRAALAAVGGFDERFPRAYREDADLALRLLDGGLRLELGHRRIFHPVGPADRWVSLRLQAGNADDALMAALHGRGWRARAGAPRGRLAHHAATTAAGALAGALGAAAAADRRRAARTAHGTPPPRRRAARVASVSGGRRRGAAATRRRRTLRRLAAIAGAAWLASTAELAWARIAPGPRTRDEVATMLATSVAMPPLATAHRLRGLFGRRRLLADRERAPRPAPAAGPLAVLLDRDGTLIADVPYNGDPARVEPLPGAAAALARLRALGLPTAVVTNQSGIGRGLLTPGAVDAVNRRVEERLGPLGPWLICPHAPEDGCACRKPAPGLIAAAARRLGVAPERCLVIGDIGADVEAAAAAGARAVLVPTARTRPEEIRAAPLVARDLEQAVALALDGGGVLPVRLHAAARTAPTGPASATAQPPHDGPRAAWRAGSGSTGEARA